MKNLQLYLIISILVLGASNLSAVTIDELEQIKRNVDEAMPTLNPVVYAKEADLAYIRCIRANSESNVSKGQQEKRCKREYIEQIVKPGTDLGMILLNNNIVKQIVLRDLDISKEDFDKLKKTAVVMLYMQPAFFEAICDSYLECVVESVNDDAAIAKCRESFEADQRMYAKVGDLIFGK